jgi:ketosteroid isomerase-like protein
MRNHTPTHSTPSTAFAVVLALLLLAVAVFLSLPAAAEPSAEPAWRTELLTTRKAVWVNYYASPERLAELLTDDLVALDGHGGPFETKTSVLAGSRRTIEKGSRLLAIDFPVNEVQRYGDVAIVYTTFAMKVQTGAEPPVDRSGQATEFFVLRDGRWLHTGWHLAWDK